METRTSKKTISNELEIGEALDCFRAGPFPTTEDVLRHLYFFFIYGQWQKKILISLPGAPPTPFYRTAHSALVFTVDEEEKREDACRKKRKNAANRKVTFFAETKDAIWHKR